MTTLTNTDQMILEALDFEPACTRDECVGDHGPATHRYSVRTRCGCDINDLVCGQCTSYIAAWVARNSSKRVGCHTDRHTLRPDEYDLRLVPIS